jgi:hypothetical protein
MNWEFLTRVQREEVGPVTSAGTDQLWLAMQTTANLSK